MITKQNMEPDVGRISIFGYTIFEKVTPVPDAEIDIENLKIRAIERTGNQTYLAFDGDGHYYLECTLEQHNSFVERFRAKLNKVS